MSAKKLDRFTGLLNSVQIAAGMNVAARNGKRLADDASLLLEHRRFASAVALAMLSIEESGKLSILRGLATVSSPERVREYWREFRSHTKKNRLGALVELYAKGARRLNDFAPLFDQEADHPHLFDNLKQLALYADCLGVAHWSEPEQVIEESLAIAVVRTATLLVCKKEITQLEIELWITHVGPYLHGTTKQAEQALQTWYSEMQRHGLEKEGENRMRRFIHEGNGQPATQQESPQ